MRKDLFDLTCSLIFGSIPWAIAFFVARPVLLREFRTDHPLFIVTYAMFFLAVSYGTGHWLVEHLAGQHSKERHA